MPVVVQKQSNNAVQGGNSNGRIECLPSRINEKTTIFSNGAPPEPITKAPFMFCLGWRTHDSVVEGVNIRGGRCSRGVVAHPQHMHRPFGSQGWVSTRQVGLAPGAFVTIESERIALPARQGLHCLRVKQQLL